MRRRKRKNLSYQRTIIVGFAALYVMCMLLSTYLVKENYENTYKNELNTKINTIFSSISHPSVHRFDEKKNMTEDYKNSISLVLSEGLETGDKYNQMNAAIYGPDGKVVARTMEYFGENYLFFNDEGHDYSTMDAVVIKSPYDYFTEEEINQLLNYLEEDYKEQAKGDKQQYSYSQSLTYDQRTGEPVELEVTKDEIKVETTINMYGIENKYWEIIEVGDILWSWKNPDTDVQMLASDYTQVNTLSSNLTSNFSFPYIESGRKYYESWKNNEQLQTFDIKTTRFDGSYYYPSSNYNEKSKMNSIVFPILMKEDSFVSTLPKSDYALQVNQMTYPWHAAIDYMKYVYLYGLVLMAVCMIKTIHVTKKAYAKQEELEQTRRDFTNAVAHELKTPLAIVRGLVENMEKEKSEEKNIYYRQEAIHQTEVMDELVKEMIFISKMDSDNTKLREEMVSFAGLIKEQMERLEPLIGEKNLHVQYWDEGDFRIKGDKSYLEKALFNLLENAVSHNRKDGMISIKIDTNTISIENTAEPISENDLPYVFDMFFTANKSRNTKANHVGLGLYLAKRIFEMHGLTLRIGNTDVGVKVDFLNDK